MAEGTTAFRVSANLTGWDQLAGLIFELYNFRGVARFEEIHNMAVSGKIDKQTYIRLNLEQEFKAMQGAKEFLTKNVIHLSGAWEKQNWLLWALIKSPDTLDELLPKNKQHGFDLREHYAELYEKEVVPEMKSETK